MKCQCESCRAPGANGGKESHLGWHRGCSNEATEKVVLKDCFDCELMKNVDRELMFCGPCAKETKGKDSR